MEKKPEPLVQFPAGPTAVREALLAISAGCAAKALLDQDAPVVDRVLWGFGALMAAALSNVAKESEREEAKRN